MKKIAVYTCITGEYDGLREIINKEKNIDYYCFTNNKQITSDTWNIIYITNEGLDNHRLARKIKILAHDILKDYDILMWQDGNVLFNTSIKDFIKNNFDEKKDYLAVAKHYCRNSIHEEALECIRIKKDKESLIKKQLKYYEQEKFPDKEGLFETTVFIRRNNDKLLDKCLNIWYDMIKNYSKRDQLSLTYATYKTGIKIRPININVWDNKYFNAHGHIGFKKTYNIFYSKLDDEKYNDPETYFYLTDKDILSLEFIPKKEKFILQLADIDDCMIEFIHSNIDLIKYMETSNIYYQDNRLLTSNDTLSFIIKLEEITKIKLEFKITKLDHQTHQIISNLINDKISLENNNRVLIENNNILSDKLNQIYSSFFWKLTKPIRGIKK